MCDPVTAVCFKQDVSGTSGGITAVLQNYTGSKQGNSYIFKSNSDARDIKQIVIHSDDHMLKSVKFSTEKGEYTANFSNIAIGVGLKASLFYYKDANTQVIENPLNN